MAAASEQDVRAPAVAGTFYPADPKECCAQAREYLRAGTRTESATTPWIGGIVPHAGWICSGAVAGETIAALGASRPTVDLVVIFGAVHSADPLDLAALDSYSRWSEPGGACDVQEEIRRRIAEHAQLFCVDDRFHRFEHAIEVELPLVQTMWPGAAILPIEVAAIPQAVQVGRAVAKRVADSGASAIYLASSDLTHYGPLYRMTPAGVGLAALEWAKSNDRRLLDRIEKFDVEGIVDEALRHANACGPGAIAAMLSAAREGGAARARVIRQTNSYQTLAEATGRRHPENAVGYASVVIG